MRWDLCCPPSLSPSTLEFSQRLVSYAWMPMTKENVKYHVQWKIGSILNHPDPPLKFSDGCWVGTTRLRKTLAKHLFHKKVGILQKHFFGNVLLKKVTFKFCFKMLFNNSPSKKLQRITTNPEHLWLPQLEPSVSKPVRLIESILLIYINLLWLDDIYIYFYIFLSVTTLFALHNACPANLGKVEVRWHRYSPRNLQLEWMTST